VVECLKVVEVLSRALPVPLGLHATSTGHVLVPEARRFTGGLALFNDSDLGVDGVFFFLGLYARTNESGVSEA
jgi:hypothetical protein